MRRKRKMKCGHIASVNRESMNETVARPSQMNTIKKWRRKKKLNKIIYKYRAEKSKIMNHVGWHWFSKKASTHNWGVCANARVRSLFFPRSFQSCFLIIIIFFSSSTFMLYIFCWALFLMCFFFRVLPCICSGHSFNFRFFV